MTRTSAKISSLLEEIYEASLPTIEFNNEKGYLFKKTKHSLEAHMDALKRFLGCMRGISECERGTSFHSYLYSSH